MQSLSRVHIFSFLCLNYLRDTSRNLAGVQERCLEHIKELEDRSADDFEIELEEMFDSTVDGFVQVGNRAALLLVEQMSTLIRERLYPELFTEVWIEDPTRATAKSIIETFHDYFLDYKDAISASFYFCTVVCFLNTPI